MAEYRICELCDYRNDVSFLVCEECGGDLSFVSPVRIDENDVKVTGSEPVLETEDGSSSDGQVEKTGKNLDSAKVAVVEGALQTRARATQQLKRFYLKDAKGAELELPLYEVVVGREGDFHNEVFQNSNFVSRNHAKFIFNGENYMLIDLDSHNGTELNGERLTPNREYPLDQGDSIVFANMRFQVDCK